MFAKNVAKFLTLRWPSYWPYNFDQKTKNQHVKIIKKHFYSVFEQQGKTTKQPNQKKYNFSTCNHDLSYKNTQKYFHFFGVFYFLFGFA